MSTALDVTGSGDSSNSEGQTPELKQSTGVYNIASFVKGPRDIGGASEVIQKRNAHEGQGALEGQTDIRVSAEPLLDDARLPDAGLDLRHVVDDFENRLIRQALERTNWNKKRAAGLLGLNRTTLVEMLKRKRIVRAA